MAFYDSTRGYFVAFLWIFRRPDPGEASWRYFVIRSHFSPVFTGILQQRAREALEQKVRRGFALWEVPVGFIRTEEGQIEKTPDRQVQQAIVSVFRKFQQLGSARQATIWFREERILVPKTKAGTAGQEVSGPHIAGVIEVDARSLTCVWNSNSKKHHH
jgi:hypothetical protein